MATDLTGTTIADTYERLFIRENSYTATSINLEIQDASSNAVATPLTLNVTNKRLGINASAPAGALEVENDASSGVPTILIDSKPVAQEGLTISSLVTTANAQSITANGLTTGSALAMSTSSNNLATTAADGLLAVTYTGASTSTNNLLFLKNNSTSATATTGILIDQNTQANAIFIDHHITTTTAGTYPSFYIDVDRTGTVGSGTDHIKGAQIDVNTTGASAGTITTTGLDINLTGDSGGTSKTIGLDIAVASADTNYALVTTGGNVGIGIATPTAVLEIEQGASGGQIAFKIDNDDTDQIAMSIEAANIDANVLDITADAVTTAKVISISADALTTGYGLFVDDNSASTSARNCVFIRQNNDAALDATALYVQSDAGGTGMKIDKNYPAALVAADTITGLHVDFDHTVPSSGTATQTDVGIDLDVNSATLGTSTTYGMDIDVVGATSGTHTVVGLAVDVGSADTNYAALFNGGNVGIGTTAPGRSLHVNSGTDNAVAKFESTDATGYIQLVDSGGSTAIGSISGAMRFWTGDAATETMRITATGKVGIGTATPEALLHIEANDVTEVASGSANLAISDSGESFIEFLADAGEANHQGVIWSDGTTQVGSITYKHDGDLMYLRAGGANVMFLDGANTRVGIGTASPQEELQIQKDDVFTSISINQHHTSGNFTNGTDLAGIFLGGVGDAIDGYSTASIKVEADGNWDGSNKGSKMLFATTTGTSVNTNALVIDKAGNVGIGTDSPAANTRLHVKAEASNSSYFPCRFDNAAGNSLFHVRADGFAYFPGYANGSVTFAGDEGLLTTSSDARMKEDIKTLEFDGLEKVNALNPVTYKWREKSLIDGEDIPMYDPDAPNDGIEIGFIAQEAAEIIPQASPDYGDDRQRGLYDRPFIAVLVKAVQELSAKVEALENNNQTGDSNNEQEQEQSAGSGDSGGDASGESSGQDSGGVEADSSDSSSAASGASEASESSSDNGGESSGSSGSNSSDDSSGGNGEVAGEPSSEWTKDELKEYMIDNAIGFNSGDTKQDLLDKIERASNDG